MQRTRMTSSLAPWSCSSAKPLPPSSTPEARPTEEEERESRNLFMVNSSPFGKMLPTLSPHLPPLSPHRPVQLLHSPQWTGRQSTKGLSPISPLRLLSPAMAVQRILHSTTPSTREPISATIGTWDPSSQIQIPLVRSPAISLIKLLCGILPGYRTHEFVHWFYKLENSIPMHVHECTILENPFPINVHEYHILENPILINVKTSLQTKITVKLT